MKKLNFFVQKSAHILVALALVTASMASGATCWFTSYQPEEPKELNKN